MVTVGSDTGGTFTDVVDASGRVVKVPSTPVDPGGAVRAALDRLGVRPSVLAHGTTVATNALLERRLARVALVTNAGMGDLIEIARQERPSLYDPAARRPEPLVPRELRLEVPGRLGQDGSEVEPLDLSGLADLPAGAEAVAVVLLHADLDAGHERQVAAALADRGVDLCCSHQVSPEMREFERTVTTVVNAALRPRCRAYLHGLAGTADEVLVMTSSGGLVDAETAAELPAALLLSGPAGGVRAAVDAAVANGFPDAVSLDMGGTSTDICLILEGRPAPAAERAVGGFTVRFPCLDVLTIGAGGGSIAAIDPGGALVVGPRSAGAVPGPACYDRGGTEPTVTDADLAAGRIPSGAEMGGIRLREDLAVDALARAGVTAEGVIAVVNANMERALREATVERGVDPRSLALVAFGGAGPLHACELAEALGISSVVVPARAGVLSAVGILTAPARRDLVRSWPNPLDHEGLAAARAELASRADRLVGGADFTRTALDCRYEGQSHELTVEGVDAFPSEHERRNGYVRPGIPVEVVAIRATAQRDRTVQLGDLPDLERLAGPVSGPTTIPEDDCTIWVPAGWVASPGEDGAIVIRSGQ